MIFRHIWIDYKQGLGNYHGDYLIPPWVMNRNRYVVDDFGDVVKFLPYPKVLPRTKEEQEKIDECRRLVKAELAAAQERLRKLQSQKGSL